MLPFQRLTFFLFVLTAMLCAGGLAQAQGLKVTYGFDREFPPFSYEKDGQPTGFEVELLQAIFAGKDVKLTMKPSSWDKVLTELSAGQIDVASGMAQTRQRLELYDFADQSSIPLKVRIFTTQGGRVSNARQLKGRRVSVQKGTLYQSILEGFGGLNIKLYASDMAALKALNEGEVEAYCGPDKPSFYLIRRMGWQGISTVGTPLKVTQVYYATNRDRKAILALINEGMRSVRASGEYDRLFRKWFVPDLSREEQTALIDAAKRASLNAYAPYSQNPVGAAVLGKSGKMYTGSAIENRTAALGVLALTAAASAAVSAGETDFRAAAILTAEGRIVSPSGMERQMLYEFGPDALVLSEIQGGKYVARTVSELMPVPPDAPGFEEAPQP